MLKATHKGDLPFKEAKDVPWEFTEGRYYHSMYHMRIPVCEDHLFGGDVTGMLWRFDDEPDSWRLVYRMRYYNTPDDPHDRQDERNWYSIHIDGREHPPDEIIPEVLALLVMMRAHVFSGHPVEPDRVEPDILEIKGDYIRFSKLMDNPPKWLHVVKRKESNAGTTTGADPVDPGTTAPTAD